MSFLKTVHVHFPFCYIIYSIDTEIFFKTFFSHLTINKENKVAVLSIYFHLKNNAQIELKISKHTQLFMSL